MWRLIVLVVYPNSHPSQEFNELSLSLSSLPLIKSLFFKLNWTLLYFMREKKKKKKLLTYLNFIILQLLLWTTETCLKLMHKKRDAKSSCIQAGAHYRTVGTSVLTNTMMLDTVVLPMLLALIMLVIASSIVSHLFESFFDKRIIFLAISQNRSLYIAFFGFSSQSFFT